MCLTDRLFDPKIEKKAKALQAKIRRLKWETTDTEDKLEKLLSGQSPIKPGDVIEWESGGKLRRGKVLSVRSTYRGFDLRCNIVTKTGKQVGFANVFPDKMPVKVN